MTDTKEETRKLLPTFPTGKPHISFSEITDWNECSYRHMLKYIEKAGEEERGNIHSAFGHAIHNAAEQYLQTKKMPDAKDVLVAFKKELHDELNVAEKLKAVEKLPEYIENLPDMIKQIPEFMEAKFPGWELIEAEKLLYEEIDKQDDVKFKGLIDGVIRIEKKPTKKLLKEYEKRGDVCPPQYEYILIDWKTTGWGWKVDAKRSFEKQMQLILYKHYFCKNSNIPLKQVKCAFVLIKRITKKERKPLDRMEYIPVSVGPVAIDKALKVLHNMINQVRQGFYVKNRKHCKPFCPYAGTRHCT